MGILSLVRLPIPPLRPAVASKERSTLNTGESTTLPVHSSHAMKYILGNAAVGHGLSGHVVLLVYFRKVVPFSRRTLPFENLLSGSFPFAPLSGFGGG